MADILATKLNREGPVLIVAPLSTLTHWYREFTRWTDLNAIVYHGSSEDRRLIREHEFVFECDRPTKALGFNQQYLKVCLKKKGKLDSPWMVDVVITTPEMMVTDDATELSAVDWELLVVDEAHRLKNHNSKLAIMLRNSKFTFKHRMLLTGYVGGASFVCFLFWCMSINTNTPTIACSLFLQDPDPERRR